MREGDKVRYWENDQLGVEERKDCSKRRKLKLAMPVPEIKCSAQHEASGGNGPLREAMCFLTPLLCVSFSFSEGVPIGMVE